MTITICSFFNIVGLPSRHLDSFGIRTGKSVFYRTLLNKEHATHSYLDLEQCNLRVYSTASSTTPIKIKKFYANQQIVLYSSA